MGVHHTKIGATLGPACASIFVLESMMRSGMDFARLNFSHGSYADHKKIIKNVRILEKKLKQSCTIMQDLQGPKIRLGNLPPEGVVLKQGDEVIFSTKEENYHHNIIPLLFDTLEKYIKPGDRILVDDGRVEVKVVSSKGLAIKTHVTEGGVVTSHKGLNFPDTRFTIPALSSKDKKDALFGIQQGIDIIALSFVKKAQDILELRQYIKKNQKKSDCSVQIIAKIERPEAIDNLEEIVQVSDGVMVARGDLGLEMPEEELPILQKQIIETARRYSKPVMVATQLLDSMRENKRPTRAEVTDVANSVIDHADSLLLTNETAVGKYPVETVTMMRKIIERTESSPYDDMIFSERVYPNSKTEGLLSELTHLVTHDKKISFLALHDPAGTLVPFISHLRPEITIIAGVSPVQCVRQINMLWGVQGLIMPHQGKKKDFLKKVLSFIKNKYVLKKGEKLVHIEYIQDFKTKLEGSFEVITLT